MFFFEMSNLGYAARPKFIIKVGLKCNWTLAVSHRGLFPLVKNELVKKNQV